MMLYIDITFNMNEKYGIKIDSNIKTSKLPEILSNFLRSQLGSGPDSSKPNVRDKYHIRIDLDTSNDSFICRHDTGNLGLRDVILLIVLKNLK